ncbi:MAG: DUF3899 domain-containing protein [Firmicutes bacterium]|nr:DUF3899 domain-containing protein [Bacillota bacterium]
MNKLSSIYGRRWVKYVVALAFGLAAVALILWARGFWEPEAMDLTTQTSHATTNLDRVRILSDAFFIVGTLMAAFGAMLFVSSHGAFDGLIYSIKSLTWFFRFREDTLKKGKRQSYYEYKEEKAARPRSPFLFLVIVGLFFVLIAGILVIKFFSM